MSHQKFAIFEAEKHELNQVGEEALMGTSESSLEYVVATEGKQRNGPL